jgi:FMN reductase
VKLVVVNGAATPPGRLARAALFVAEEAGRRHAPVEVDAVDLARERLEICDGRPEEAYAAATRAAVRRMREADAAILASPIYRASIPGVLKNLLDLLPVEALQDKPVGLIAMGASEHHYLAIDGQLRPVLAWFGALVLPTHVYLTGRDFEEGELRSEPAREEIRSLVDSVVSAAARVSGLRFGPQPLASRARG